MRNAMSPRALCAPRYMLRARASYLLMLPRRPISIDA